MSVLHYAGMFPIMVASRYGIVAGIIAGTYDILMYSHVVGFMPMMYRYARHVVPLGLMGATFAVVANGVQHYRDADDPLNYFLGGAACGPLVGIYTRSKHGVVPGALLLGVIGIVKKEAVDGDHTLFPKIPTHMNTVNGWRQDWTIAVDPRDEMRHTCEEDFDDDDDEHEEEKKSIEKKKKAKEKEKKVN